jgi:hypothetical protein
MNNYLSPIKKSPVKKKSPPCSSSSSSSSSSDLGHFRYKIGDLINGTYKIEEFLGDGTFGRVLECSKIGGGSEKYAVKVGKILLR